MLARTPRAPHSSVASIACAPRRFFQPGCCRQVPYKGMGGPVEPATVAKVEAPLNGRVLWKGLPRVSRPRACSGNPYQINKKGQHQLVLKVEDGQHGTTPPEIGVNTNGFEWF